MPQHIKYIDKICREKQRDVLYLTFDKEIFPNPNWPTWQTRNDIINWLEQHNINYTPCGNVASQHTISSYRGQIYIDVPYDETEPDFIKLSQFLEHPDGSTKIKGVIFCYLTLEHAMKNKHHDEPGFWENLMEEF